jgi:hypothetical protein
VGAPFDRDTLDDLAILSSDEILECSSNLQDKLTASSRATRAQQAEKRDKVRPQGSVEQFFDGKHAAVVPLLAVSSLSDRIDEAIARHNTAVLNNAGVGRYKHRPLERIPGSIDQVVLIDPRYNGRRDPVSMVEGLAGTRCWELAEDLERIKARRPTTALEQDYEASLASRKLIQLRHVDPATFSILYSRDHSLIVECSTGQRWSNCFSENCANFESVGAHIECGCIGLILSIKTTSARAIRS